MKLPRALLNRRRRVRLAFHLETGALALMAGTFLLLYTPVILGMVHDWRTDDNFSHGFLIPPIALYLVWERRAALAEAPRRSSWMGLLIVMGSVGVLAAGILGAELFLTRVSLLGVIAGSILFILGWHHLRLVLFPIAILLLMIPMPAIILNRIAVPLQLLASRMGEGALSLLSVPVLREGNLIILEQATLDVAEACSGIRSLMSLLTIGIVLGYFVDRRPLARLVLASAALPIAVVANGVRVAGTGLAAHHYGASVAQGFFHSFSGWVLFGVAITLLYGVHCLLIRLAPPTPDRDAGTSLPALPA